MTSKREVLISGGGIAGPALAYWLGRYGFAVTLVEKARGLRGGGYPIDVRGTALEVVRRMGILPRLRAAHVDMHKFTFLDVAGDEVAVIDPRLIDGSVAGQDLEVRRGDLAEALHAAVGGDVELVFGDSIAAMTETGQGVDVTFASGGRRTYEVVIGADGLHSRTREMVFGPEDRFHHYLGHCFAGFTMPNILGLAHEGVLWSTPGRAAVLYAAGDGDEVHGFLTFARQDPPFGAFRDPAAQRDLVAATFADAGWRVPDLVAAMREADDLFFDTVSQIRMPAWSSGRVALVGDAAYAPSFLTGQGTSLALVGAYMLARSLAVHPGHEEAFAAYERDIREFVTLNQAHVDGGGSVMFPATQEAMDRRDAMLRDLTADPVPMERPAHSALTLPDVAGEPADGGGRWSLHTVPAGERS